MKKFWSSRSASRSASGDVDRRRNNPWWTRGSVLIVGIALITAGVGYFWSKTDASRSVDSFLHLLLPALVLFVELFMLGKIIQESRERAEEAKERERVMTDLDAFRVSIGRANYMQEIERAIVEAKSDVMFTSATMATTWAEKDQKRVFDAVERRQKQSSYGHRGVVAKRVEALPGAIELLSKTHVQVRMSDVMLMSRLRFVVRDFEFVVIGVAEGEPSLAQQPETKRSFSVESTMLARAMRAQFEELWKDGSDPWTYLDEILETAKKSHPDYSLTEALKLLGNEDRQRIPLDKLCAGSKVIAELRKIEEKPA